MLALMAVLVLGQAQTEERLDHRGALGLMVQGGGLLRQYGGMASQQTGLRAFGDVGVTAGLIGDKTELMLFGRVASGALPGLSFSAGVRQYFGRDHVKTFFDLNVAVGILPALTVGPRLAFGVQYDVTSIFGFYAGGGGHIAVGEGLLLQGELFAGVQVRSYVFEL